MAYALVGSPGAAVVSTSGGNITTLAWGTGESRTAGNLLLLFVSGTGSSTAVSAPSGGWARTGNSTAGTSCSATVFYKIAAGSDAAPTITGVASTILAAHLEEWSGNDSSAPEDTTTPNNASGTTSPLTCTLASLETSVGELIVMCGADRRSVARASNDTWTSNHGTPTLRASNNGTSSTDHYTHATMISNSDFNATTATMTLSITTSITGLAIFASAFKLPAIDRPPLGDTRPILQQIAQ